MRYAKIDPYEVVNGEYNGMSLYIQGCPFHCDGCFNSETWDFNSGNEWTKSVRDELIELAARPYIKRISILGGEPLCKGNLNELLKLVCELRKVYPDKAIWLFTGFTWDEITLRFGEIVHSHNGTRFERHLIIQECDVVVDGQYMESLKDPTLKWRGSKNQRVIDVKRSLEQDMIVLKE